MRVGLPFALPLIFVATLRGQEPSPFPQAYALPTGPTLTVKFKEARTYIKAEEWGDAVRLLQGILETSEDAFVPIPQKEVVVWGSARREALRLIDELPKAGRETYETTHGPRAAALLNQAKNQPALLADVVRFFLPTRAGAEAARLLGIFHLDRGRPGLSARCFAILLDDGRMKTWDAPQLVQPILAFHRAGDRSRFDSVWAMLAARAPDGLTLGKRKLSLDDLKKQLGRSAPQEDVAAKPPAALKTVASVPISTLDDGWWHQTVRKLEVDGQPVLPALHPLIDGDRVVFRTLRGIAATDLDGKLLWESASGISLDALASDTASFSHVNIWIQNTRKANAHLLLDNRVLGSLSAGAGHVYGIDDIPLPPYPDSYAGYRGLGGSPRLAFAPELSDAIQHSRLFALEADSGKIAWEVGGRGTDALDDTFFLGAPLVLANRLYALAEKDQELKLHCLDSASGKLLWSQPLGLPKNKLLLDGGRRAQGASLVHADGMLLCMTNAGAILAFDLLSHSFRWATFYHKETPPAPPPPMPGVRVRPAFGRGVSEPPGMKPAWRNAHPHISGDLLLLSAPDEATLVCLNLRDGSLSWRVEQTEDDLYVSTVAKDVVVIAGKTHCRALKRNDGKETWRVPTGMPGGVGVRVGSLYHLPVRADTLTRQAGILVLDIATGKVVGRTALPRDEMPGNLVYHKDRVLSQNAMGLTILSVLP